MIGIGPDPFERDPSWSSISSMSTESIVLYCIPGDELFVEGGSVTIIAKKN